MLSLSDEQAMVAPTPHASLVQSPALPDDWMKQLVEEENNILTLPFPGEPKGIDETGRASLWRMQLLGECARNPIRHVEPKVTVFWVSYIAVVALSTWAAYSMGARGPFVGVLDCVAMVVLIQTISHIHSLADYKRKSIEHAQAKLTENSWPVRMQGFLVQSIERGAVLSPELRAFQSIFKSVPLSAWSSVSSSHCVDMDGLVQSMEATLPSMTSGSVVRLSGERSELLHTVCAVVTDDLDTVIQGLETPTLVTF